MSEIIPLLVCLTPHLTSTSLNQMSHIHPQAKQRDLPFDQTRGFDCEMSLMAADSSTFWACPGIGRRGYRCYL